MGYRKMTVEIDEEKLRQAREALGTRGVKETVNAALHEVGRKAALGRSADFTLGGRLHLPDEATWAAWREPRG